MYLCIYVVIYLICKNSPLGHDPGTFFFLGFARSCTDLKWNFKKTMYTLFCFRCIWVSPEHQINKQNEPNKQNVYPGAESWMWLLTSVYIVLLRATMRLSCYYVHVANCRTAAIRHGQRQLRRPQGSGRLLGLRPGPAGAPRLRAPRLRARSLGISGQPRHPAVP